jgi:hypothetical protein
LEEGAECVCVLFGPDSVVLDVAQIPPLLLADPGASLKRPRMSSRGPVGNPLGERRNCDNRRDEGEWNSRPDRSPAQDPAAPAHGARGGYEPSMFTARAATSSTVTAESADSRPIIAFARRDNGIVSVGLNAMAFVKAT